MNDIGNFNLKKNIKLIDHKKYIKIGSPLILTDESYSDFKKSLFHLLYMKLTRLLGQTVPYVQIDGIPKASPRHQQGVLPIYLNQ